MSLSPTSVPDIWGGIIIEEAETFGEGIGLVHEHTGAANEYARSIHERPSIRYDGTGTAGDAAESTCKANQGPHEWHTRVKNSGYCFFVTRVFCTLLTHTSIIHMPKPLTRIYHMSDADLIQRTDAIAGFAVRDATAFLSRNVDAARISALQAARDDFDAFPTDEELAGAVTVAVSIKKAARKQLEDAVDTIRGMADQAFEGQNLYSTFRFEGFSELEDNDVLRAAKRIHRVADKLTAQLTPEGLTPGHMASLQGFITALDLALDGVDTAVADRDIETQRRIGLGNALYTNLSRIGAIGRNLFENTDEARYNDYVLEQSIGQGTGNGGGGGGNPPA